MLDCSLHPFKATRVMIPAIVKEIDAQKYANPERTRQKHTASEFEGKAELILMRALRRTIAGQYIGTRRRY